MPQFLYKGSTLSKIEPDFFIVNVASGQPSHTRFNILKKHDFPSLNRGQNVTKKIVIDYLKKYANQPTYLKYSNFNLLICLSNIIDVDVSFIIYCVTNVDCRKTGRVCEDAGRS